MRYLPFAKKKTTYVNFSLLYNFTFGRMLEWPQQFSQKNIFSTINTQKIRKHSHTFFSKTFQCYVWYEKHIKLIRVYIKTRKNAIVEYLDYQIPVNQLKWPKGNGDMQEKARKFKNKKSLHVPNSTVPLSLLTGRR